MDSFCNLTFSLCTSNLSVFFRFSAKWNCKRRKALGLVIRFMIRKCCKPLLCIALIKSLNATLKSASTLKHSYMKGPSPLKGDKMWTFIRLQAIFKLSVQNCSFNALSFKIILNIYLFSIFLFLIHGNLFLSIFTSLFVTILRKISNYHLLNLPRNLHNFSIFL